VIDFKFITCLTNKKLTSIFPFVSCLQYLLLFIRLENLGIANIRQLPRLSNEQIMDLTQEDPTYSDYKKVKAGVERLRKKGVEFGQVETDLLDHHRAGYMPNAPYSWWSLLVWGEQLITLWALTKHTFTKVYWWSA